MVLIKCRECGRRFRGFEDADPICKACKNKKPPMRGIVIYNKNKFAIARANLMLSMGSSLEDVVNYRESVYSDIVLRSRGIKSRFLSRLWVVQKIDMLIWDKYPDYVPPIRE